MLKMRENILLFYNNLTSSFLRITLKIETYIRTHNAIVLHLNWFHVKNLPVLQIAKSVSGDKGHPVPFIYGWFHDSFDGYAIVGLDSVGVGGYSCNLFKSVLGG